MKHRALVQTHELLRVKSIGWVSAKKVHPLAMSITVNLARLLNLPDTVSSSVKWILSWCLPHSVRIKPESVW